MCILFSVAWLYQAASPSPLPAEVTAAEAGGFQLKIERTTDLEPAKTYEAIVRDVDQWWLDAHTYSGDAANLSFDLEKGWFVEKLAEEGFVRHMEVVFHQPGKLLRLSGGLGPLQGMGLHGAMTISITGEGAKSRLTLIYNVSGFSPSGLKDLAPVVDQVLTQQVESLQHYCAALEK
jgi:uncharacterized protein YndB with AHSA1/START domain